MHLMVSRLIPVLRLLKQDVLRPRSKMVQICTTIRADCAGLDKRRETAGRLQKEPHGQATTCTC